MPYSASLCRGTCGTGRGTAAEQRRNRDGTRLRIVRNTWDVTGASGVADRRTLRCTCDSSMHMRSGDPRRVASRRVLSRRHGVHGTQCLRRNIIVHSIESARVCDTIASRGRDSDVGRPMASGLSSSAQTCPDPDKPRRASREAPKCTQCAQRASPAAQQPASSTAGLPSRIDAS